MANTNDLLKKNTGVQNAGTQNVDTTANTASLDNTQKARVAAYTPSENVTESDANAKDFLNQIQSSATSSKNNGIVSGNNWNKINSDYQMSNTVSSAMDFTNGLLEQLSTGKTTYSDRVDQRINEIMNQEEFSYDPDTDTLFQQALSSAMNSGKSAMQDTMGQAASLTGGYGSSYATSAANQSYNDFIEGAYDNLPEYYNMALQTYQMDTENMYNKLGMLNNADDKEYNRLYTAWNANFSNWTQLYDMEYNQWRDSVSFALQSAGLELDENSSIFNQLSNAFSASQNYSDSAYNRDYGQYQDSITNAMNQQKLNNSTSGGSGGKGSSSSSGVSELSQTVKNAAAEAYKKAGSEGLEAYIATLTGIDDVTLDTLRNYAQTLNGGESGATNTGTDTPTEKMYKAAAEAYYNGGEDGLDQYLNYIDPNYNTDLLIDYATSNTDGTNPEYNNWTKVDQTYNWMGGTDNNDKVKDPDGNEYSLSELKEMGVSDEVLEALNKLDKGQTYKKPYKYTY
ncbi:MAG: hypothetical protein PHP50_09605 [Lachnospiraceae bacterium]|nr:hypothetical protein [Lachnospiraceae bacterium]